VLVLAGVLSGVLFPALTVLAGPRRRCPDE
jgi:hypothetical protein